jgi:hypothetical protein
MMLQDTIRNEFRRALTKQVDAIRFFKMITWIFLSLTIVTNIFLFHYKECDGILFEHERMSLRRDLTPTSPEDIIMDGRVVDKGIVVDFDVFRKDNVFHGFRTVRMNTSGGYPVTCTIPVTTGPDAKKVEEVTSFDSPFETSVVWLEDEAGLCKEVGGGRRLQGEGVVVAVDEVKPNDFHRRLGPVEVVEVMDVEMCSRFQRSLIYSVVSLVVCWLVVVTWDQKLMKYHLSDFLKDRKDLTDLLKSYEAQNSKSERSELYKAIDSVRKSVLEDVDV